MYLQLRRPFTPWVADPGQGEPPLAGARLEELFLTISQRVRREMTAWTGTKSPEGRLSL
jgi:hypothetical protein